MNTLTTRLFVICLFAASLFSAGFTQFANQAPLGSMEERRDQNNMSVDSLYPAGVKGNVTSDETGLPVKDAIVTIADLNLSASTDANGDFIFDRIVIKEEILPVTITVQAGGFGEWTIQNVRLVSGDTLILSPRLTSQPYLDIVPPPRSDNPDWQDDGPFELLSTREYFIPYANLPLPEKIRIRVSGYPYNCDTSRNYKIQVVDFKQYVKDVLPNEWGASWPANSIRAGAMAVKMYAWNMIAIGGKWPDADVWDSTCDQVYNPNFEMASTNAAVDYIWDWLLNRSDRLMRTYFRAHADQCPSYQEGECMGQWDSKDMADAGKTWQQILFHFYTGTVLDTNTLPQIGGYYLRFNGLPGDENENRILIPVDDPNTTDPGPPVDVGGKDFTIEWWMKAEASENSAKAVQCGSNKNWVFGNIVLDRDISKIGRSYGVSLAGGRVVFGVTGNGTGSRTICGTASVADGNWHYIVIQRRRSDGMMWLFVDGHLEVKKDGPDGDISYPDDHEPDVESDPFLSIGAWKKDTDQELHPFFQGWIDEMRISNVLRYSDDFSQPAKINLVADGHTVALYHFDEGIGSLITDASEAPGGESHGNLKYGGVINGPDWVRFQPTYIPLVAH